jgi:predicted  nucleic acid-binding Zn-ribbon protein
LRDEVAALRSEAATLHTDAATLRATLAATEQQLAATEQQLAATIEAARKQVADLTADAEARIAAFAADLAGARRDLDAMQSSSSWRLTAPVRRLVTAVRGR